METPEVASGRCAGVGMAVVQHARERPMQLVGSQTRQPPRQEPPPALLQMEEFSCADVPGVVFHPTDEHLVVYYLRRYISDLQLPEGLVVPADVYGTEPWNLLLDGREEGFFFCGRTRRAAKSKWPSRAAGGGSWQSFKKEEEIKSAVDGCGEVTVGIKNSLAYKHRERKNFGWVMYEFELFHKELTFQETVLCHIKQTRKGKRQRNQIDQELLLLPSSDNCTGDGDDAYCCSVIRPLKKRRRDDQTSEPTSSKMPQIKDDHVAFLNYQEHPRTTPCSSSAYTSAAAAAAATIPPPPQEQLLASSCDPVGVPPSTSESSVDQETNVILDFISCRTYQQQQISSDAHGTEVQITADDLVGVHGEQHIVPICMETPGNALMQHGSMGEENYKIMTLEAIVAAAEADYSTSQYYAVDDEHTPVSQQQQQEISSDAHGIEEQIVADQVGVHGEQHIVPICMETPGNALMQLSMGEENYKNMALEAIAAAAEADYSMPQYYAVDVEQIDSISGQCLNADVVVEEDPVTEEVAFQSLEFLDIWGYF